MKHVIFNDKTYIPASPEEKIVVGMLYVNQRDFLKQLVKSTDAMNDRTVQSYNNSYWAIYRPVEVVEIAEQKYIKAADDETIQKGWRYSSSPYGEDADMCALTIGMTVGRAKTVWSSIITHVFKPLETNENIVEMAPVAPTAVEQIMIEEDQKGSSFITATKKESCTVEPAGGCGKETSFLCWALCLTSAAILKLRKKTCTK